MEDLNTETASALEAKKAAPKEEIVEEAAEATAAPEGEQEEQTTDAEGTATDQEDKDEQEKTEKPDEKKEKPKGKGSLVEQIAELRKKARNAEAGKEAAYWRGKAEALESTIKRGGDRTERTAPEIAKFEKPRPIRENFQTIEDYEDAVADYRLEKRDFEHEQKESAAKHEAKSKEGQTEAEKRTESFRAQHERGAEKYDDFAEVASSFPCSVAMAQELQESEIGEDVAYYLGQHHEEAKAIDKMTGKAFTKAMAILEHKVRGSLKSTQKLEDKHSEEEESQTTKKSAAPPPPPKAKAKTYQNDDAKYMDPTLSSDERIEMSRRRRVAGK